MLGLGDVKVSCLLYADDLVIMSRSEEGLQRSLDTLNTFSTEWKLKVKLNAWSFQEAENLLSKVK
jgi:hypothetical protein